MEQFHDAVDEDEAESFHDASDGAVSDELEAPLVAWDGRRRPPPAEGSLALDAFPAGPGGDFRIPRWVAWGVPSLAAVACGCFLVGQLTPMWGLGASLTLRFAESSGQAALSQAYEPYQMSLFFSIKCCLQTGLLAEEFLGVVLFFFSGIWPHVKLGLMLFCWFKPRMNHRLRHIILYWVDAWGKFSFADPLVVVALMVVFSVGVDLSAGDLLFPQIGNVVLKAEGLDDTLTLDDVASINLKLDIVGFYGIYFFCLGVWLSLILGAVVEHYNVRLMLLVTRCDDVLAEDGSVRGVGEGATAAAAFRSRTWWPTALATLPLLPLLLASYVEPIFQRTIDGVLPMLASVFGWVPVVDPPSALVQPLTYGQIFHFLATQESSAIWIMIVTIVFFVLVAPTFRSLALDVMWFLPASATASELGLSRAEHRRRADVLLSASNVGSLFDALAVWLFAVALVLFEIGAISSQIAMPWCADVAVGAQMLESFCPELGATGGFFDDPKYHHALSLFSKKYPGWNDTLPDFSADCDDVVAIAQGFNLDECLDLEIGFLAGMFCVVAAVLLSYGSSLLLSYPWSMEVFGRDFFEAPVCFRPGGWFCCCCCVGRTQDGAALPEEDKDAAPHCEYSCKKSLRSCCWCCRKDHDAESEHDMMTAPSQMT